MISLLGSVSSCFPLPAHGRFVHNPGTDLKLAALTILMRPSLELMGSFFEESRWNTEQRGLLPFLGSSSPALAAVKAYVNLLNDEEHADWKALVGLRATGWSAEKRCLAFETCLMLALNIWRRCVYSFVHFPWRLGQLVGDDLSRQAKLGLIVSAQARVQSESFCCVDKDFTMPFIKSLERAEHAIADGHPDCLFLRDAFKTCPCCNIATEDRFARANVHNSSAHGNYPNVSTLCSNHVLAEAKSALDRSVLEWASLHQPQEEPRLAPKLSNAWQAFLHCHSREGSLKELSARWRALSAEDKEVYNQRVAEAREAAGLAPPQPPQPPQQDDLAQATPLQAGDPDYPIRKEILQEHMDNLRALVEEWELYTAGPPICGHAGIDASPTRLCSEFVGPGHCMSDLSDEQLEARRCCLARLKLLGAPELTDTPSNGDADLGLLGPLRLFHVQPGNGLPAFLMLLVLQLHLPYVQSCVVLEWPRPTVPDLCDIELVWDMKEFALSTPHLLTRLQDSGGTMVIHRLYYRVLTLHTLQVVAREKIDAQLDAILRARKAKDAAATEARLALHMDRVYKKTVRKNTLKNPGQSRRKKKKKKQQEEDSVDKLKARLRPSLARRARQMLRHGRRGRGRAVREGHLQREPEPPEGAPQEQEQEPVDLPGAGGANLDEDAEHIVRGASPPRSQPRPKPKPKP